MSRSLPLAIVALMIAGCAAKNETATATGISLKCNDAFTDFMAVVSQANEHCSRYAKVASLADTSLSPFGTWHTHTRYFRCEDEPVPLSP